MYTIIDLIDKIINMKEKAYKMYKLISHIENIDNNIKVVARILASEVKRHIKIYKSIKIKVEKEDIPCIDFGIYDQASNLINNFRYPNVDHIKDINELLHLALDFEEQRISLIMSIQGLLIRESTDSGSVTYKVLTQIIREEQKYIENIENFLR